MSWLLRLWLLNLLFCLGCQPSPQADELAIKLVYISDGKLFVSPFPDKAPREIASQVSELVSPRWSPDGTRVLYAKPGATVAGNGTLATLVVVDDKGAQLAQFKILTGENDGVFVAGMRQVADIGWLDSQRVYAHGSVNPNVDEFRLFDVTTSAEIPGYTGFSFTVCPSLGKVAYFEPRFGRGPFVLAVNGDALTRFEPRDENGSFGFVKWIDGCAKIALIESLDQQSSLLILSEGRVQHNLVLPLYPVIASEQLRDALLLNSPTRKVIFESVGMAIRTSDFDSIPAYTDLALRKTEEQILGARLADWYPAFGSVKH
jgi:hypothetical protein